ncbi:hypothetical protein [Caulobacter mirabilis]|nr:hypothetical protein [Caulobacter mirabilis]
MTTQPFDAHTARARGWRTPDWWPTEACPAGVAYGDDPFAEPPRYLGHVVNWCPGEGRAYVQSFRY